VGNIDDSSIKIRARGKVKVPAMSQAVMQAAGPARANIGACMSQAIEPIIEPRLSIQEAKALIPTFMPEPIDLTESTASTEEDSLIEN